MKKDIKSTTKSNAHGIFNNKGEDSIINLIPYKSCSEDGVVRKTNILYQNSPDKDLYQVFLSINTTDLESMTDDELARWADSYTRINRIYSEPLKLISMARKTKVTQPIKFWKNSQANSARRIASRKDIDESRVINRIALETLQILREMERNDTDLKFYFVVTGKTLEALMTQIRIIKGAGGPILGLMVQNKKEVTPIITRLMNMNDEGD